MLFNSFKGDRPEFIVIDTEGQQLLREIAIIDGQGRLVYEAFVDGHYNNESQRIKRKSLPQIINDLSKFLFKKTIICHHVNHDKRILKDSFKYVKKKFPPCNFVCTLQLTKKYYPHFPKYSLEYISKQLRLKLNQRLFNNNFAHSAAYDAKFTHQLYLHLLSMEKMNKKIISNTELSNYPNPFTSSRVDNPFQVHLDFKQVYQTEYESLKSILQEVKKDSNNQSKGAVIIGEAGTGKTHLIMRIAKELLIRNRVLFIRQPNNSESIFYHTYNRILESFNEKVDGTKRTQLELLIAHSFVTILSKIDKVANSINGKKVIDNFRDDSLNIYEVLGKEDTKKYQNNWDFIERNIINWWSKNFSIGGYGLEILKGMIKFCRYSRSDFKDIIRRWLSGKELSDEEANQIGLKNWNDDLSREEFALDAIAVFGKLSTLDEPLIIVFDQLEGLGLKQNQKILENFGLAIKEILTHVPNSLVILNLFPDRWQQFKDYFDDSVLDRLSQNCITLSRPAQSQIEEILNLKSQVVGLSITDFLTEEELKDILSQSSIRSIINRASDYYRYKAENVPLPPTQTTIIDNPKNLETRVQQLENILQQIAHLTSSFLKVKNDEQEGISLPDIFPDLVIDEKENKENNILFKDRLIQSLQPIKDNIIKEYQLPQIITDSDDFGKLNTIVETITQYYKDIEINQLRLGNKKLPEHLSISDNDELVVGFLHVGGSSFTTRLRNFNELIISNPKSYFLLFRDKQEPPIKGRVGKMEIEKINNTKNGKFIILDEITRVNFELVYQLIIQIQEKDLELDLEKSLMLLPEILEEDSLITVFLKKIIKN
ncbi:exonuclease [Cyanobacterium stanieri LEGE 03274]|uniref:Exonuclease n=1 Tax=Cyanobacterium stanieri LEGE 03274 TaxID=1828756 RepID=A0ABR9V0J0_9CHRO|nr:exonuclease domain-containing protein [Cyanobacterium stanieri]MBE9221094.1 exonuclease [Cyanobacterium stanieri LEGE 03274]